MGDNTITLRYHGLPLDGLKMDGQIWLRVTQIVTPLGFAREQGLHNIVARYSDEFTSDETRLIIEQTPGGPQTVRVFSLRGARLLAMLARTEPAARFRRWLLDLLEGRAPVARPEADPLERLPEAQQMLAAPMVAEALAILDAADAAQSDFQRQQAQERQRARRLAHTMGLNLQNLRDLREVRRILERLPSLAAQPALPLDADPSAA
jgi:hypothetical protein